jgi:hypothetical protein
LQVSHGCESTNARHVRVLIGWIVAELKLECYLETRPKNLEIRLRYFNTSEIRFRTLDTPQIKNALSTTTLRIPLYLDSIKSGRLRNINYPEADFYVHILEKVSDLRGSIVGSVGRGGALGWTVSKRLTTPKL